MVFLLIVQNLILVPDGLFTCKCHPDAVIEIKCPCYIRDQMIKDSGCNFLNQSFDGELTLKESHQYYTQVQSQMTITYENFVILLSDKEKDFFYKKIEYNDQHSEKVERNLSIFLKSYVCPVLFQLRFLTYCGKFGDVLLEKLSLIHI